SAALGHELKLESRVGRGSRFSIIAPYAAPVPRTEPDAAAPPHARADLVAKPLIVIDNDLGVLEAMQALLSRWGADVHLARDLEDVAEILSDPAFAPA